MKWEPAREMLIVKKHKEPTPAGLILPDAKTPMWIVIRAGAGCLEAVGRVVLLDGLGGLTLDLDGEECRVVHVKHVIARRDES